MENENLYEKIQSLLKDFNGKFSVLEEEIDIKTQMDYFEYSKSLKSEKIAFDYLAISEAIFSNETSLIEKKRYLILLASNDNAEAYRILEKYRNNPDPELKDWAILALQENKMLLESVLLEENQLFISTGMGGKGTNLRYFIVLLSKNNEAFTDFQKKIISSESAFILKQSNAEMEKFSFSNNYCCIKACIPFQSDISAIFTELVKNCNQFGHILEDNYILTNIKELSNNDIEEILQNLQIPQSLKSVDKGHTDYPDA